VNGTVHNYSECRPNHPEARSKCDGLLSQLAIWLNCQFCQWRENFLAPTLLLVAADVIVCQELRAPDAIWMPRTHGSCIREATDSASPVMHQ
jgi:hypothetical protein